MWLPILEAVGGGGVAGIFSSSSPVQFSCSVFVSPARRLQWKTVALFRSLFEYTRMSRVLISRNVGARPSRFESYYPTIKDSIGGDKQSERERQDDAIMVLMIASWLRTNARLICRCIFGTTQKRLSFEWFVKRMSRWLDPKRKAHMLRTLAHVRLSLWGMLGKITRPHGDVD